MAQLIARSVWDREVEGLSPFTPTTQSDHLVWSFCFERCYDRHMKKNLKQWAETHQYWALGGILAIFSGVALGNMTRWSIWFDEAFSAYLTRFDLLQITQFTAQDVHPPVYYWLLKIWTEVFGSSLLSVRSLSLFCALIGLVGLYFVVRYLMKSKLYGLAAVIAAALTPTLVRFTDEARMYTLVFAIVMWATYVLLRAVETNRRWLWALYGVLLAVGMLTHYFTAMAWLAHWVWRYFEKRSGRVRKFFAREWVLSHVLSLILFAWWLPMLISQFAGVQAGFWIPPVTPSSPVDYLTDALFYRDTDQLAGWGAFVAFAVFALAAIVVWRGWPVLVKRARKGGASLIASLALAPPVILMLLSMPPLKSAFISRYVLYAQVMLTVAMVLCAVMLVKARPVFACRSMVVFVLVALFGLVNVYYYGNYNKTSNLSVRTGDVMAKIASSNSDAPVLAASPWMYYEASFYSSSKNPVYYPADTLVEDYGSLAMLKQDDTGRVDDVTAFASNHRYIWYIYSADDEVSPPGKSWKLVQSVDGYDSIDNVTKYRAGLYDTQSH